MIHTIDKDLPPEHSKEIKMEILRCEVNNFNSDELLQFVEKLEDQMGLNCTGDKYIPFRSPFEQFFKTSERDESGLPLAIDIDRVTEQKRRLVNLFSELYHRSIELSMTEGDRITRLIETVDDYYELVFRWFRVHERINNPNLVPISGEFDGSFFRVKTLGGEGGGDADEDEKSSYQRLLLYFFNELKRQCFKRYKGQCCKQITVGPYTTRAWKSVMEIKDFVYLSTQKEDKYDMWKNLTARTGNVKESINHLTNCMDIQFPEIKKNRHVWSFRNGLFIGKEWDGSKYTTRFYPYSSPEFSSLDPTIVSCKYFDQDFDDHTNIEDWYNIPTPFLQSVFDYQNFSEDVARWMYVFAGRMCFDVNEMDGWQVIGFLKGIAGSGKSTIITKVIKKFYDNEDVKTLSNNIEKKFGLWSIHDGLMFISPEVKGDLALEQAEFQSMVSGEDVSIARKNEKALSKTWNVPGILAGNEVPNWKDNSGSVQRRVLAWNFTKQVLCADPHLDEKLELELPCILQKCVMAYLDYARKYSDKDIWSVVPKYFKEVQKQISCVTNTLQHFLESEKVQFGHDKFVPQRFFLSIFTQHCTENNLRRPQFNPDTYAGPFSSRELTVKTETVQYRGKMYPAQAVIHGIDIIQEQLDNFTGDF
jgi:hypothetical protein